jgi:SNF2 family DNA or RNA helicase
MELYKELFVSTFFPRPKGMQTPAKLETIILIPETPHSPLNNILNRMTSKPRYELEDRSFYGKKPTTDQSNSFSKRSKDETTSPYLESTSKDSKRRKIVTVDLEHDSDLEILDIIDKVPKKAAQEPVNSDDSRVPIVIRSESTKHQVPLDKLDEKTETEATPFAAEEELDEFELEGLRFINTADHAELVSSLKCAPAQADFLIEKRPFADFELIEIEQSALYRLLYKYILALQNFGSVDEIIHHCDRVGKDIKRVMNQWNAIQNGSNITPKYPVLTSQPDWINSELQLKQYQLTGISWMLMLHEMKLGGILADEMGLGKSAQVICFLALLNQKKRQKALIIVPSSTLDNWMREIEMWCPTMQAIAYSGSQKERRELQYEIPYDDELDIIVTTYNQATGNSEDRRFLRSLKCPILILDEGHMIKNGDSQRAKHLKGFNAPFKMLITGTPIQNNLMELLSLLIFINPELFAPAESSFAAIFDKTNTAQEGLEGDVAKRRIERATKILTPFVLRRKKDEVRKEIPTKTRVIEYCEATTDQRKLYQSIMRDSRKAYLESEAVIQKSKQKKKESNSGLTNILMQLRKAANHQLLIRRLYTEDKLPLIAKDLKKVTKIHVGIRVFGLQTGLSG